MPGVSQSAFVCFLRLQGVFVDFVEHLFSGVWPITRYVESVATLLLLIG